MKKVLFILFGGAMLMIGACSNSGEETSANKMLANVLAQEDELNFYGEMTMTFKMEEIEEIQMKEWRSGKKSRVEVIAGEEENIAVNDGETLRMYEPQTNKLFEFTMGELQELNNNPKEQLNMVLETIKDTHDVEKMENETILGRDTVHIKAEPKEEGTLLGEQQFWVDTEHWIVIKYVATSADYTSEMVYTKLDFNVDMGEDIFQLDVPKDAEVESFDEGFEEQEIALEEINDMLEEEVLYVPEENGFSIDRVTTISIDENNHLIDLEYKKDDVAHIVLTIISPGEDNIEEQLDIFGNEAEAITVRDEKGMYIDTELMQTVIWNEGAYQYNMEVVDPSLTVEDAINIAEQMEILP